MNQLLQLYHSLIHEPPNSIINESPLINKHQLTTALHPPIPTPLSIRKSHELSQLIPLIQRLIIDNNIEFLIDVGSGNSYLSRYLRMATGTKTISGVICIERDQTRHKTSKRLDDLYSTNTNDAIYLSDVGQLDDNDELRRFIRGRSKENGSVSNCLIIGLDVCGDFTNQVLKRMMSGGELNGYLNVKGCCLVSCCFHKITRLLTIDDTVVELGLTRCSEQDLSMLDDQEVLNKFAMEGIDRDYGQWLYEKGVLSRVLESIVHQDRLDYLELQGVKASLEIVFDFNISSRNVALVAIK